MRCIGIDYGEKRIGVSFGDDLGVATPLPAIRDGEAEDRLRRLSELISERRATNLVIGYPYNMDGSIGFKAREVDAFVEKLTALSPLPVHRIDERLTTHEASQYLKKGRDDELRRSGKVDSMAATLILQDYLNQSISLPDYDEMQGEGELD